MARKVAIIYGFSEGEWQSRKFCAALEARGFTAVKDPLQADIVVAHSGGVFTTKDLRPKQLLVLVNPPYWPGKSLQRRAGAMTLQILRAIRRDNHPLYQARKTLQNVWYVFRHARTNTIMVRRAYSFNLNVELQHRKTLLVRNDGDPWLTPNLSDLQANHPQVKIYRLPGEHDDLWLHPEPYINLIQSEL